MGGIFVLNIEKKPKKLAKAQKRSHDKIDF